MNTTALVNELSDLLATETRSLSRHLDEAKPYLTPATYPAWNTVRHLGHASAEHAHRISDIFESLELSPIPRTYPSNVAYYHYVSLGTLLPLLIADKKKQIDAYQRAIEHAADQPAVRAELESLLAENRTHLDQLNESLARLQHAAA